VPLAGNNDPDTTRLLTVPEFSLTTLHGSGFKPGELALEFESDVLLFFHPGNGLQYHHFLLRVPGPMDTFLGLRRLKERRS
jgi:hypothetical protein